MLILKFLNYRDKMLVMKVARAKGKVLNKSQHVRFDGVCQQLRDMGIQGIRDIGCCSMPACWLCTDSDVTPLTLQLAWEFIERIKIGGSGSQHILNILNVVC